MAGLLPEEGTCSLAWAETTAPGPVRSAQRPQEVGSGERRVPFSCGSVIVAVPLEVAQEVVRALDEMDQYVPRLGLSEQVGQQVSDGSEVPVRRYRQVLPLPFPVRDRVYQIDVTEGWLSDTEGTASKEAPERTAPVWWTKWELVPGSGNMLHNRGAWLVERLDQRRVRILYLVDSDPGGGVPAWLVRKLAQAGLRDALGAVADRMLEAAEAL